MTRRRQWRRPLRTRYLTAAVLAAGAAAVLAGSALAKEGVEATLTTPVPLDAASGKKIALAWTLISVDEDGREQPFGAQGVYVTLVSAADGKTTTGYAEGGSNGRYSAAVAVPEGGIGGIQIALMGSANGEPAPVAFPIANNPLPDVAGEVLVPAAAADEPAPAGPPPIEPESGADTTWIAVGLGILVAAGIATAVLLRRRRPLSSA